jgi:hypothetical protein
MEYVAVVSRHGKPESVHLFDDEEDARKFALDLSASENWERRESRIEEHEDHVHEFDWLEDWGDEDGCGVVAGIAHEEDDHHHDH